MMTEMYLPGEVQKLLGIDGGTLRRYASLLEGHGYDIQRNNRGHRSYCDKDVDMLRKLMEFSKQEGMTIERSAEEVMMWVSDENKTGFVTEETSLQNTIEAASEENPFQNTTYTVSDEKPLQNTTDSVAEESLLQNTSDPIVEENPFQNVNDLDSKNDYSYDLLLERIDHLEQINSDLIQFLKEKAVREAYLEQKINEILKYVEHTAQLTSERSQLEEARMQVAAAGQKKWWKWWK